MSLTIKLPESAPQNGVHAGIQFTDGVAEVPDLVGSAAKYFQTLGATVADVEAANPLDELRVGDQLLRDLTVPQLRDLANTEGIDVPAKATKPEILSAFLAAFTTED